MGCLRYSSQLHKNEREMFLIGLSDMTILSYIDDVS